MMEEERAKLDRIYEKKGESNVASPLEPLIVSLLKGFVDDVDLGNKLQTLYKAPIPSSATTWARAPCQLSIVQAEAHLIQPCTLDTQLGRKWTSATMARSAASSSAPPSSGWSVHLGCVGDRRLSPLRTPIDGSTS